MEVSTNLGRVSLVPRGRYDGAAVYNRLDIVEYEGSSYLVLADGVTGVTPQAGAVYMLVAEKGDRGDTGAQGVQGETGNGITGIQRTAGSGAPGTRDTYTITYTDGSTDTFQVYNGADGTGAGDMRAETYDPTGKAQDVFAYADAAAAAKQDALLGQPGQVVVFNADGKPEAQDPPDTGVTSFNGRSGEVVPQEGDYTAQQVGALPITGGTMEGDVTVPWGKKIIFGAEGPDYGRLEFYADLSGDAHFQYADDPDITERESTRIGGIAAPKYNDEAANKKYVDERAAAGRRGVNLLDNWYFPDTINQRGQTEYTSAGYTIDRWSIEAGAKLKVLEDGVVFTPNPSNYNTCTQYVENYKELVGKQLTLSVLIEENTCANCLLWFYGGNTDNFVCVTMNGSDKLYSVTMTPKSNITSLRCGFQGRNSAGSVKIQSSRQHLMGGLLLRAPSKPAQPQRGLTQLAFQPHRQLKGALLRMNPHAPVKAPLISPAGLSEQRGVAQQQIGIVAVGSHCGIDVFDAKLNEHRTGPQLMGDFIGTQDVTLLQMKSGIQYNRPGRHLPLRL